MCMDILTAYISMYHMHALSTRARRTGFIDSCKLPYGSQELSTGLLEEHSSFNHRAISLAVPPNYLL